MSVAMKPKRTLSADSATREALIDATEQLLCEEGYAAISSRRIGARAGVKGPLIHYYFDGIDDLYLAVFRRMIATGMQNRSVIRASDQPLHMLWSLAKDPKRARLTTEFMALAIHRPAIREEIARVADESRRRQIDGIVRYIKAKGLDATWPAAALPVIMSSLSYLLSLETALGISVGHEETEAAIATWLDKLEGPADTLPDCK